MKNRERGGGRKRKVVCTYRGESSGWRASSPLDKASIEEELSTINYITGV